MSLTDHISVVHRGNCSFLQKAVTADMGGASGLVIVYNSSTRLVKEKRGRVFVCLSVPLMTVNLSYLHVQPFPGGDDDPGIQLPVVMVTSTTGQILQVRQYSI